jgi:acetylornithine/N-succinyldiaminopimelate aminotransferase
MIDTRHLMDITERPALVFVRGAGSWLVDHTGKRYLDFVQGWAVNCLGHSPSVIVEALAGVLQRAGPPPRRHPRRALGFPARVLHQLGGRGQ